METGSSLDRELCITFGVSCCSSHELNASRLVRVSRVYTRWYACTARAPQRRASFSLWGTIGHAVATCYVFSVEYDGTCTRLLVAYSTGAWYDCSFERQLGFVF